MTGYANKGLPFENELLAVGVQYWALKIAWFKKLPVAMGFDKKARQVFRKEKTGFDFYGAHFTDGVAQPLFFEAKDVNKNTLPLLGPMTRQKSGVHHHQLMALAGLERCGCECYIIWRTSGKVYRMSAERALSSVGVGNSVHVVKHSNLLTPVPFVRGMWDILLSLK